jgi:hypothetical protein
VRFLFNVTTTDQFFALEEALDQYVMNTEDIEDQLREQVADDGDEKAQETLRRLDAAREMLDKVTAVLCSLADGAVP